MKATLRDLIDEAPDVMGAIAEALKNKPEQYLKEGTSPEDIKKAKNIQQAMEMLDTGKITAMVENTLSPGKKASLRVAFTERQKANVRSGVALAGAALAMGLGGPAVMLAGGIAGVASAVITQGRLVNASERVLGRMVGEGADFDASGLNKNEQRGLNYLKEKGRVEDAERGGKTIPVVTEDGLAKAKQIKDNIRATLKAGQGLDADFTSAFKWDEDRIKEYKNTITNPPLEPEEEEEPKKKPSLLKKLTKGLKKKKEDKDGKGNGKKTLKTGPTGAKYYETPSGKKVYVKSSINEEAIAKRVAGSVRIARMTLKKQPSRSSERMWVAFDEKGYAHGFIRKFTDTRTDKFPFQVFVYPYPVAPGEMSRGDEMLGSLWVKGKKGLRKAFDLLQKGRKFGEMGNPEDAWL
jgi:hypothetical protein